MKVSSCRAKSRPSEYDDDDQSHPHHGIDLAVLPFEPADLQEGGGDCDRRGDIDVEELESGKKTERRETGRRETSLAVQSSLTIS